MNDQGEQLTWSTLLGVALVVVVGIVAMSLPYVFPGSKMMRLSLAFYCLAVTAIGGYSLLRKKYKKQELAHQASLLSQHGVVVSSKGPDGLVRIGGELWSAQSFDGEELVAKEVVIVRRVEGLKVFVERR